MLKKSVFSIEGIKPFPGYHDPGENWNGWAVPYFEWDVAAEIVEWINEFAKKEQLKVDGVRRTIISVEDPESPFDIEGMTISTEEGEKLLYPVGTGWWIWDIYEG